MTHFQSAADALTWPSTCCNKHRFHKCELLPSPPTNYGVAQSRPTLLDTKIFYTTRNLWHEIHQFRVQSKQFITYLLVLADQHLHGGLHLQHFVYQTIHRTVKNSAQQRFVYGRNFVPNSTLRHNIRMDLQEVGCGYMDWIGLAQDRDRWRTFGFREMRGISWLAANQLASQEGQHHGVSNSSLRLLCCVSAITVYTLFQVSPQEPSGPAAVRKNAIYSLY